MNKENLERLEKNPHYTLSDKQRAELTRLRQSEVKHTTSFQRHNTEVPKHPRSLPKQKEADGERAD